jgi:hypothetical protein
MRLGFVFDLVRPSTASAGCKARASAGLSLEEILVVIEWVDVLGLLIRWQGRWGGSVNPRIAAAVALGDVLAAVAGEFPFKTVVEAGGRRPKGVERQWWEQSNERVAVVVVESSKREPSTRRWADGARGDGSEQGCAQ